mmetsp:Transcript_110289/g.329786  ORF Transcript_110289/g.329786 Transcript_110289/m.329786 type:complete len:271 (+) Transcript_110289:719-1531(+)
MQRPARRGALPNVDRVVIPARGQGTSSAVVQAADEVRVGGEAADAVLADAHVVVVHLGVGGAAAQDVLVPSQSADAAAVAAQAPQLPLHARVPELDLARGGAHAEVQALARPAQGRGVARGQREQALRAARRHVEEEDGLGERHPHGVARRPVHGVAVEVVHEPRGVQDLRGPRGQGPVARPGPSAAAAAHRAPEAAAPALHEAAGAAGAIGLGPTTAFVAGAVACGLAVKGLVHAVDRWIRRGSHVRVCALFRRNDAVVWRVWVVELMQ